MATPCPGPPPPTPQTIEILRRGYRVNPEPPPKPKGQKDPVKRSKSLNLLKRMHKRWEQILGYFHYPGLYPYDNNQAERDVRMMKVREKISGTSAARSMGKPSATSAA